MVIWLCKRVRWGDTRRGEKTHCHLTTNMITIRSRPNHHAACTTQILVKQEGPTKAQCAVPWIRLARHLQEALGGGTKCLAGKIWTDALVFTRGEIWNLKFKLEIGPKWDTSRAKKLLKFQSDQNHLENHMNFKLLTSKFIPSNSNSCFNADAHLSSYWLEVPL